MTGRLAAALFIVVLLISGCAGFSTYSISESALERHLQDAVASFDRQQLDAGSPLSLSLDRARVTLGPEGREVAIVELSGQVALDALIARLPAELSLKVEGTPVYDNEERAIYLRRLRLLESQIDTPFFNSGDLAPITQRVVAVVARMLETVPVYRLDDTSLGERLLGMSGMTIRVAPGRLEFVTP